MVKIKILLAFELILIVLIIALLSTNNKEMPTAYAVKESRSLGNNSFKILTKAVCENKSHVFCHDELFASCNGKERIIPENKSNDFVECGNARIRLPDIIKDIDKIKKDEEILENSSQ